jgi:hypothetical protein
MAVLTRVVSCFRETNEALLGHLKRDSEWLQMQHSQYTTISGDFPTVFLYEVLPTQLYPGRSEIVAHATITAHL